MIDFDNEPPSDLENISSQLSDLYQETRESNKLLTNICYVLWIIGGILLWKLK